MAGTTYRRMSPAMLAEFRDRGDTPEFWAGLWSDDLGKFLQRYETGNIHPFEPPFTKYLPRDQRIIEAGCGRGQYVVALRQRGYDVVGADFAEDLVEAIRHARPDAPVEVADVRHLPAADNTYGAYISLGVVEHFWDGPEPILREAHRVLRPGGILLASVPHFSPGFRRHAVKAIAPFDEKQTPERAFYQFYFSREEFLNRVGQCGFTPLGTYYYAAKYGAKRAYPLFDRLYDGSYPLRVAANQFFKLPLPQRMQARFAHMVMVIARKS